MINEERRQSIGIVYKGEVKLTKCKQPGCDGYLFYEDIDGKRFILCCHCDYKMEERRREGLAVPLVDITERKLWTGV